jgi:hypothetical protein
VVATEDNLHGHLELFESIKQIDHIVVKKFTMSAVSM